MPNRSLLFFLLISFISIYCRSDTLPPQIHMAPLVGNFNTGMPFSIVFFSCSLCKIDLLNSENNEPSEGLFINSLIHKKIKFENNIYNALEIELISFMSGTINIPGLSFNVIETLFDNTTKKQYTKLYQLSSSEITIDVTSSLKNNIFAELYEKIKTPVLRKFLFITALTIFLTIILLLIIKKILYKKPRAVEIKSCNVKDEIRNKILSFKDYNGELKSAYFQISDHFRTWLELNFNINAHELFFEGILQELSKNKIAIPENFNHILFTKLNVSRFSKFPPGSQMLNKDIDLIIGIIDEF